MNKNQDSIIDSKYLLANQHQKNLLANQHQIKDTTCGQRFRAEVLWRGDVPSDRGGPKNRSPCSGHAVAQPGNSPQLEDLATSRRHPEGLPERGCQGCQGRSGGHEPKGEAVTDDGRIQFSF